MGQRTASVITLLGLGLTAAALFLYTPSPRRPRRQSQIPPPPATWQEPESPAMHRLLTAFDSLSAADRGAVAQGIPYNKLPARFRSTIYDVLLEKLQKRAEQSRSDQEAGLISKTQCSIELAYDDYVPKHISDYSIRATGDQYALLLFRTLLPGHDLPKRDVERGPQPICPLR